MPSRVSRGVAVPEFNARKPLAAGMPFAIAMLLALGGCSADSGIKLGNLNPFTGEDAVRQEGFNYFYRKDTVSLGPVTAADLVGPDGRCAFAAAPTMSGIPAAPAAAYEPPAAASPINPRSNQALYFTAGPESGRVASAPSALPPEVRGGPRGISLAMTECQVVDIAGYTDRVEIGANERGERVVTLSYLSGDRPGIYRFRGGRLISMERVAEPTQARKPQRATTTAKNKQAR